MPREWDTPVREPWNPLIRELLRAIDRHNQHHFATGNAWHLAKAETLRSYVRELKTWISHHEQPDRAQHQPTLRDRAVQPGDRQHQRCGDPEGHREAAASGMADPTRCSQLGDSSPPDASHRS